MRFLGSNADSKVVAQHFFKGKFSIKENVPAPVTRNIGRIGYTSIKELVLWAFMDGASFAPILVYYWHPEMEDPAAMYAPLPDFDKLCVHTMAET